ncbi:MAG TPA: amidohydrolase family protein [Bryobacteraceae bacterium]|nr:amidohydrolase family protein [Bryobacteraceae bacterium]
MAQLKVVDTHAHLGECCVFGLIATEEEIIRRMEENGVDATIIQPYPGAKEAPKTHDRIAELCAKYPGRFYGLASMSPHGDHDAYTREIERCVKDLKFVGVKLHTIGHGVNPLSEDGDFVFQTAHDLGIPAMVHTGPGVPFALPALCIPAAQKYPGLKIILAHAGFAVFTAEAQVAASICGNLYLETSWCIGEDIRWMISTIGPERVMMGADLPSNVPVEIAKYRALDLEPAVYDRVMGGTAIEVFKLQSRGEYVRSAR